jgi:hypothetical protein
VDLMAESNLTNLKRDELDALAKEAGVPDPESLPNREAVIDAIDDATRPGSSAAEEGADAAIGDRPPAENGAYYVTAAGAPYAVQGDLAYVRVAMHGEVIELVDKEAARLISLGAVRAATDAEVAADRTRRVQVAAIDARNAAGPDDNPFGGQVVNTTFERHAEEQIALARKSAALPDDAAPNS